MDEQRDQALDTLRDLFARSTPKVFGPHFEQLVAVIEEELGVMFAMDHLGAGQPEPDREHLHRAAVLIADGVDEAFRLEPKPPRNSVDAT